MLAEALQGIPTNQGEVVVRLLRIFPESEVSLMAQILTNGLRGKRASAFFGELQAFEAAAKEIFATGDQIKQFQDRVQLQNLVRAFCHSAIANHTVSPHRKEVLSLSQGMQ